MLKIYLSRLTLKIKLILNWQILLVNFLVLASKRVQKIPLFGKLAGRV